MEEAGNTKDEKNLCKGKRECKKFRLILTHVICRAQTKISPVTFICLHIKRLKYFCSPRIAKQSFDHILRFNAKVHEI